MDVGGVFMLGVHASAASDEGLVVASGTPES
jgi:hypothetical protein